jgi:predicted RNA-binding protein
MEQLRKASCLSDERVLAHHCPWSWVPLLQWLNIDVDIDSCRFVFPQCAAAHAILFSSQTKLSRHLVEVACSLRPETIDALYKVDRQWPIPAARRQISQPAEPGGFLVTNNASFDRQEIIDYEKVLASYTPVKRQVVLVPCAAIKPYPSPLHLAVLRCVLAVGKVQSTYLAVVTGVLGIIPQELWEVAPPYDSGIPNRWRVQQSVREYFRRFQHDRVIVYADFYSEAIKAGLDSIGQKASYVLEVKFRQDYENLLSTDNISRLIKTLEG